MGLTFWSWLSRFILDKWLCVCVCVCVCLCVCVSGALKCWLGDSKGIWLVKIPLQPSPNISLAVFVGKGAPANPATREKWPLDDCVYVLLDPLIRRVECLHWKIRGVFNSSPVE